MRRCSCWLSPAEWSQARAQPSPEARRREAERPAFATNWPHRNIPGRSRRFDCRRGQYWFLNNRPNVVSPLSHFGDCRSWCWIAPELALASFLKCRCVTGRRPRLLETECCQPNSNQLPCVLAPTWPCLESNSYSDSRRQSRTGCRFGEGTAWWSSFGFGTTARRRAHRNRRQRQWCRPGCCG